MTTVKYHYIGDTEPKFSEGLTKLENDDNFVNPLFNFRQEFIDQLNSITPLELGQSVPYVRLEIMDLKGKVLDDLNLSFFHQPININKISEQERYTDRPLMSLKDLDITTDNASGHIFYTRVNFTLKIHKPDLLSSQTLIGLLFPGVPLQLTYGWNSPNTTLLNQKQKLLLSVITYTINIDKARTSRFTCRNNGVQ